MVQSDQDEKFAGTYRKLFDTIERGVEQCSTDRLQTLIEEKKDQLKLGLEAFGEPSSQSRSKVTSGSNVTVEGKTIKLEQKEKDLIITLSDILNLNELQCASLWEAYRQANKDSLSRISNESYSDNTQLKMSLVCFYFEDRISLLECIGSLQRISLNEDHPYTSIANDTISKLRQEDATVFVQRLFTQYAKLIRSNVPSRNNAFPGWSLIWAKQTLREQKALLEIIFLFSLTDSFSPKFIFSAIQEFEADCFGYLQAFGYVLDDEGILLRDRVCHICTLLSVNLVVPSTLNVKVKLNPASQGLIDSPDYISKINQVVAHLGDRQEHAVFLLAWSFFLTCVDIAANDENTPLPSNYTAIVELLDGKQTINSSVLIDRPSVSGTEFDSSLNRSVSIKQGTNLDRILLGRSLKLNVFDNAISILESEVCSEEDVNSFGYRSVMRHLLNSFLSVTLPGYIPIDGYTSLVNAFCLLYKKQPGLCEMFWTEDFDEQNSSSLLSTARNRFPVFFTDFTELLSALTGANDLEMDGAYSANRVFEYLCNLPNITVVLAPSVEITAQDENGKAVTYASKPIVVTQSFDSITSIVIPEASRGLLLNPAGDDRVVKYNLAYSGWHMLTAVLAGYVTDYKASNTDIQDNDKHLQGKNIESIESILNLIHNVLSSSSKLAPALIQHIDTAVGNTNATPVLISVLCSILNTSSTMQPCPISILTMSLKCLTLLIPFYSNDVWSYLKFAPILPTANPRIHLATLSSKPNPASQIQEIVSKVECTMGRYQLLLAFLDMVQGLVHDIQRSWWVNETQSAGLPNRQYQVEVLYICLHYLMSEVFPSYAQWRYKRLSDRFLIGTKMISIFTDITTSFKEPSTSNKLSLSGIREGIFSNFLYEGGIYHTSPLVDTISEGAKSANALYKLNHPKEAQRIEKLTEMTFIFIEILLEYRLQQINTGNALAESNLERLLLERSGSSNSSDFLLRVARHIHYRHNIALPTHATKVLTLLCRTTAAWTNVPNFVQYLGSTDQVHAIIRTYLQIAKDHFQNETLLTSIWRLMTALLETQPSLSILFLDCGDFIMPSPKSAVRLLNGQTQPTSSSSSTAPVSESAIRAATDVLSHWETLSVEKPSVLSNILRFLATFWKTAFDHYALVERARVDNALWDLLGKVLLNPSNEINTSSTKIQSADLLDTDSATRYDIDIRRLCCLNLSKAFVMRIMAYEIHLSAGRGPTATASQRVPVGLKNLLNKLGEPSKLAGLREAFVKNDFDPSTARAAEISAEHLLQTIGIHTTTALLFKIPRVGDGDDVETAGQARQYGDNYLYDFSVANDKVQSLYKDISNKYDYIHQENLIVTPEVQAVLDLKQGCNTFLQNVLLVNYNSSIVDTQIMLLDSFKTFMETASRRVADVIWANKSTASTGGADALYSFLNGLIDGARQETRDDGVTLTSYSILIQTIRNLTEDWINMNSAVVTGIATSAKQDYTSKTYQLLSALCGLLDRENYALFNSICDHTAIRFHRPLLESIMLSLRTLSGNINYIASNGVQLESCLSGLLSVVCSSFHVLVIKASSYSAEGSPVTEEVKENCIKDVTVVISLLQELINPKYKLSQDIWLNIFEKSHTIQSLLLLFNSGVALVVKEVDSQSSNTSGVYNISITPYAESALYFLLALSNIPKAATALVSHGIFESLFQNALTPRLQRGELDLFIRFGNSSNSNKNAPAYVERNPLHFIWCQMLGVISNLMRTIGSEGAVLFSIVNYMQMYGPQIGTAFNNANGANDSIFGLTPSESLSSPLLEEIERINMIFFNISKYLDRLPNIANNLFVSFKDCSLFLLQRYLYFFTHPSHMQAQLYPVDNVERQQAQTFVSSSKEQRTSQLMRKTLESILTITHTMLTTLIILTNTDIVLTAADVEWPFGNTIIYPEMRVTTGESASFGTLMECISNCMDKVTQWQQEQDYIVQPLLEVIKDCALLLTTQAALWIAKPNISDEVRVEIAQENVTDIMECMTKVGTSLAKLQESNKFNVKSKLKLIQLLKSFLAERYYEQ